MCNFNTKLANTISRKNVFIAFFCCLSTIEIYAQTSDGSEKTFCDPSIPGQPRPKFLEITRGTSTSFSVENISQFDGIEDGNAQATSNSTLEIKLNAPVLLKPGLKIIAGLKYFREDFEFANVASPSDIYFRNLHDKSLRSIRGSIFGIKSFKGNAYLATRFSASLNGDMKNNFTDTEKQYVNFSAAALLGWKKNATFVYGFGLAYTNMFGVNRIYPVVALEKSFNQHWGFEALLPKTVSLRYVTTDKKNNFYGMMSLDGGTYRINIQELIPNQDLVLQRNEIQGKLVYEREIYDWIWLGVEAGVRKSINGDLTFPGDRKTTIYDTQFGTNAFVNFSLFLVPPRKLLERF
jgi:hypothetical protein